MRVYFISLLDSVVIVANMQTLLYNRLILTFLFLDFQVFKERSMARKDNNIHILSNTCESWPMTRYVVSSSLSLVF